MTDNVKDKNDHLNSINNKSQNDSKNNLPPKHKMSSTNTNIEKNENKNKDNNSNFGNKEKEDIKVNDISSNLAQNSNQKAKIIENNEVEGVKIPETDYKENKREIKSIKSNEVKFISGNLSNNIIKETSKPKFNDNKVQSCRNKDNSVNNITPESNRWRTLRGKNILLIIKLENESNALNFNDINLEKEQEVSLKGVHLNFKSEEKTTNEKIITKNEVSKIYFLFFIGI